jgi:hypothetical protein
MLVLGVIGLITSVLVVGGARLLRDQPTTPEDVFWRAVHEARTFALLHQCEVRLRFDNRSRSFRAETPFGSETYPVRIEGDFHLEFLSTQKGGNSILIGGSLVETQVLPSISFFDDGSCTPFRVQLRTSTASQPRLIGIDPWTCAPVLATTNEG